MDAYLFWTLLPHACPTLLTLPVVRGAHAAGLGDGMEKYGPIACSVLLLLIASSRICILLVTGRTMRKS
jgi:hypothetical protein